MESDFELKVLVSGGQSDKSALTVVPNSNLLIKYKYFHMTQNYCLDLKLSLMSPKNDFIKITSKI